MKRMLAFFGLMLAAVVVAASGNSHANATASKPDPMFVGGHWTPTKGDSGSFVVMNGDGRNAYLGFMQSANKSKACEFAIGVDRDEVHFQIVDKAGGIHMIPVTALLKLEEKNVDAPADAVAVWNGANYGFESLMVRSDEKGLGKIGVTHLGVYPPKVDYAVRLVADKPAVSKSDAPVAPVAGALTEDHKFIYAMARAKAVTEYARVNKVSRAAAREKVDSLDDATLHAAVVKSGAFKIAAQPVGGKLSDFLDWILSHQDQIAALVKLILSLLMFI